MSNTWTILTTIQWLTDYLEKKGLPEARLNAEQLIAYSLGIERLELYLRFEYVLTKEELSNLKPLIERRAAREPLQHILGTQPFRNITISVSKGALIPRPETEVVVGEALAKIPEDSNFSVLEIGVGSGAILAALADERKSIQLTGTEISEEALEIANKNIQAYKDRLSLHLGDLFEPIDGQKFDMIVSNPPYISSSEFADLEPEVRLHDPKIALIAGEDGLDFYRRILNDVGNYLKDGGWLILELGDGQAESVVEIAREKGEFKDIAISKDLAGKERVFSSQFLGGGNG